jgi:hypothetical protein
MTKTKLLLAGLLTGAVAFGSACKTDTAATGTSTGTQTTMPASTEDAGTGGAGINTPRSTPLPDDGVREREPDVHNTPIDEPGTGGSGMEPDGMTRPNDMRPPDAIGNEPIDEPMNTPPSVDSTVDDDNTMTEDTQPLPKQ